MSSCSYSNPNPFASQDARLKQIVESHGAKNWKGIAEMLGTLRNDVQCLHRWNKVLKPGLHKGPWSEEEVRSCEEVNTILCLF